MPSLRDMSKRIKSVKSTQKITRAMKMVAAAKLRKAQDEVRKARPFAQKLEQTIAHLTKRLELQGQAPHPLLVNKGLKRRVEVVVLTSDRGLCGGFNTNILRKSERFLFDAKSEYEEIRISTLGKKGYEHFMREGKSVRTNYQDVLTHASYKKASEISAEICKSYVQENVDAVFLVYNEFKSAISQTVVVKQMLPIKPAPLLDTVSPVDYIYEPEQRELLNSLIPKYFATLLYQSFLESVASEYGSRMTAMDNATRNAKEMISSLTLKYNRARQAAITSELMEIIGGAEAISA
ncbi:ATP synthase F1 subunit gamma [Sulfobacillus acidophilus]|uniref:ATP synthase gamma chain n=1 Tax=Sulfobacillus acidophilus TaxID=53633 RepID=A0ABS3AVR6_9FIRM|nr:ATP synthase F1 subunit gamma [Sulfobacillus acidophilus]